VSRVYIWESAMSWRVTYLVIIEADPFGEDPSSGAECRGHYLAVDIRDDHLGNLAQLMNCIRDSRF
jgi:hypothetical protein